MLAEGLAGVLINKVPAVRDGFVFINICTSKMNFVIISVICSVWVSCQSRDCAIEQYRLSCRSAGKTFPSLLPIRTHTLAAMASPSKLRQRRPLGASRSESYDQDDEDHVDAVYQRPVRPHLFRVPKRGTQYFSFTDSPERV